MSPADRAAASAMKSEARLRFLERRTRRSPRMSCSATTVNRSVSKPDSSGSTAAPACPGPSFSASASVATRLTLPSPCSSRICVSRSSDPSVQPATTTLRFCERTEAMCDTAASNTLALGSARSSAKLWPLRAPACSTLRAPASGASKGENSIEARSGSAAEMSSGDR